MTRFRKTITASLAALTLGGAVLATTTPASAWGYWHHGGWGWGGPAVAAGVATGLALGAVATGGYGYGGGYYACRARQPVYDGYGYVAYYRTVRVPC